MPGGMRLSFDQMSGKAPGEQHHHSAPMLYTVPPPQSAAGAGAPGANVLGMGELMRKKRGRPRKYAPDGSMALALAPISSASAGGAAAPGQQQHGGGFSISSPPSDPNAKRRGRPPGSGKKKQFEALGSWGIAFTPHILTVKAGEDVASKIMTFSQQGPRTVCILSARTGGLSVALAGSDGRVLGGCVAGMLMAATPVQVVVASFIAEGKKSKPAEARKVEPMAAPPPQMATFVPPPLATSPPSEGTSSASSDDSGSPIHHSAMPFSNSSQHQHPHQHQHQHMPPAYASGGWSLSVHQQNRHDSDMKMMSN
ncbi:AT-hook motif nuclear-localized protein 13 [Zea mays]|uniref:AT-hook motif nuclear-localized protein n=1 Tax=Zea mays TaxID=4577 RepID=A0A1D6K9B1_MAIZE|nr:AT-hook motif nuclear-localized protein 13 [Zea mays]